MRERTIHFLQKNFIFYLCGFLILFLIKLYYSHTDCSGLRWILFPTASWVTLLSGIPFSYEVGMGYLNENLQIVIAPACSGVQFMIIVIATMLFSFVHRIHTHKGKIAWMLLQIIFSYPLTIFVNGLRILLSIYLPSYFAQKDWFGVFLTPERLHTAIGAVIYFVSLLLMHRLAEEIVRKITGEHTSSLKMLSHVFQPLFWYLLLVLGIPFLNHAWRKNSSAFTEYTLLVISICLAAILPYFFSVYIHYIRHINQEDASHSPCPSLADSTVPPNQLP